MCLFRSPGISVYNGRSDSRRDASRSKQLAPQEMYVWPPRRQASSHEHVRTDTRAPQSNRRATMTQARDWVSVSAAGEELEMLQQGTRRSRRGHHLGPRSGPVLWRTHGDLRPSASSFDCSSSSVHAVREPTSGPQRKALPESSPFAAVALQPHPRSLPAVTAIGPPREAAASTTLRPRELRDIAEWVPNARDLSPPEPHARQRDQPWLKLQPSRTSSGSVKGSIASDTVDGCSNAVVERALTAGSSITLANSRNTPL